MNILTIILSLIFGVSVAIGISFLIFIVNNLAGIFIFFIISYILIKDYLAVKREYKRKKKKKKR